jgi:hypothetical protein
MPTVSQLKAQLKALGLSTAGLKAALEERLKDHEKSQKNAGTTKEKPAAAAAKKESSESDEVDSSDEEDEKKPATAAAKKSQKNAGSIKNKTAAAAKKESSDSDEADSSGEEEEKKPAAAAAKKESSDSDDDASSDEEEKKPAAAAERNQVSAAVSARAPERQSAVSIEKLISAEPAAKRPAKASPPASTASAVTSAESAPAAKDDTHYLNRQEGLGWSRRDKSNTQKQGRGKRVRGTDVDFLDVRSEREAHIREKEIGGSGGSLEPPGPILTHLHTVYMSYSECLPNCLNPWLRGPISPRRTTAPCSTPPQ